MDHRGAFSMYWDVFKDNQSFLKVFSFKTNYDLISIKLSAFFFSLAVDFTLNAVFFSDDVISEKYKNNGKLSFLSEILKSLYSAAIGLILSSFILSLSSYTEMLELLSREYKFQKGYVELCKSFLSKVKRRIVMFFALMFVLMFFFLYYVSLFCIVYKGSQLSWFKGGWISFAICLLITLMRFFSLSYHSKYAYNTAIYLNRLV